MALGKCKDLAPLHPTKGQGTPNGNTVEKARRGRTNLAHYSSGVYWYKMKRNMLTNKSVIKAFQSSQQTQSDR